MESSGIFRLNMGPTCRTVNMKFTSYWSCVKIHRINQGSATRGPQLFAACEILINAEQNRKAKNMEINRPFKTSAAYSIFTAKEKRTFVAYDFVKRCLLLPLLLLLLKRIVQIRK